MSDSTTDVFDGILVKIAQNIHGRVVVDALGTALGFKPAAIGLYNAANEREGGSYMGTLDMLRKWHQDQTAAEKWSKLKTALVKAELKNLADDYLSINQAGASSQYLRRQEKSEPIQPDGKGYYKQKMQKAEPSKDQLDLNKSYKMDVIPKGRMFMMNITKDREGSEVDAQNIEHVFKEIGYEIKQHWNLTAKELKEKLEKFVNSPKNEGMCSAVFMLMGHGNKSGIECFDGKTVTTEYVRETVYKMKSMVDKPKMIFFQCCRAADDSKQVKTDGTESDGLAVRKKSDVLIAHATIEGHAAYRDVENGTWFIQMLCEELLEKAHISDLSSMLDRVTGKVKDMGFGEYDQSPVVTKQGISKSIYFLPKYP